MNSEFDSIRKGLEEAVEMAKADSKALDFLALEFYIEYYKDLSKERQKVVREELVIRDNMGWRS